MSESKDFVKELFVSFFFVGKSPVAPGTFGSLGALILAYYTFEYFPSTAGYILLVSVIGMYYIGLQVAPWCEDKYGKDPGTYVVDEVIGYFIAISFLIIIGIEFSNMIWGFSFLSFRIFDVLKIWPAKDLEKIEGGHGIILDDVVAGFQTLILVLLVYNFDII